MWEYFSASSWRSKVRFFFTRERKHIHTTAKELTQTHTITGGGVRKREKERRRKSLALVFELCEGVWARKGEEFCEQVVWVKKRVGRKNTTEKRRRSNRICVVESRAEKGVFFSGVIRTVGNEINNNSNKEYWRIRIRFHSHTHHARTAQETPQQLLDGATNNNNNNSCCLSDDRWWRLLLLLRPCRWCHPSSRLIPHVTFSGVWTETIIGRGVNILCVCEIDAGEFVWVFLL